MDAHNCVANSSARLHPFLGASSCIYACTHALDQVCLTEIPGVVGFNVSFGEKQADAKDTPTSQDHGQPPKTVSDSVQEMQPLTYQAWPEAVSYTHLTLPTILLV